jgi:hypothetical protein
VGIDIDRDHENIQVDVHFDASFCPCSCISSADLYQCEIGAFVGVNVLGDLTLLWQGVQQQGDDLKSPGLSGRENLRSQMALMIVLSQAQYVPLNHFSCLDTLQLR